MPKEAEPNNDVAAAPLQTIRKHEFLKKDGGRNDDGSDDSTQQPHHRFTNHRSRQQRLRLCMYEESVGDVDSDSSETTLPGVTFIPGPRYTGPHDSVMTPSSQDTATVQRQVVVGDGTAISGDENQQQHNGDDDFLLLPSADPIAAETVESRTDLEERLRQQITNQLHATAPIADLVSSKQENDDDDNNAMRRMRRNLCLFFMCSLILVVIVVVVVATILANDGDIPTQGTSSSTTNPTIQPVVAAGKPTHAPTSPPSYAPTMMPSQTPTIMFWTQRGDDIVGEFTGERIGDSVALSSDGSIVAVGGQGTALDDGADGIGRVRVYRQRMDGANVPSTEVWIQLGNDITGTYDRRFGRSICLSGDGMTVAIGEHFGGNGVVGRAVVYRYNEVVQDWVQLGQDLFGEIRPYQPWFGWSVALSLDATTLAVGAPVDTNFVGTSAGQIKVFRYISKDEVWEQLGSSINGEVPWGQLGISVSISADGTMIAGGAYFNDARGSNTGQVRVYRFIVEDLVSGDWVQVGQDLEGRRAEDFFGWSVSLSSDGKTVACGAILNDDGGEDAGQVRVFELVDESGTSTNSSVEESWQLLGEPIGGESSGDGFGISLALSNDGRSIVVGADQLGIEGIPPGYVRILIYDNDLKDWAKQGKKISGQNQGDRFGTSSACSAECTVVAAGSPRNTNSQNGQDAGQVRVYEINQ